MRRADSQRCCGHRISATGRIGTSGILTPNPALNGRAGAVRIEGHPENTAEYVWGDKTLRNVRCKTCGCATHWEPLVPEPGGKHGVNLNNFDPRLQEGVQVRRFDGADTWKFID